MSEEKTRTVPAPLVWMDLEMSGLDPRNCEILEIATIVTGADLDVIAEGPDLVIHHPDAVLDAMDEWNKEHHGRSGLAEAVRRSEVSMEDAQRRTLEFLAGHCQAGRSPLCGNSICQDRQFLIRHMPDLERFLHYRNVDVSSIKELVLRWYPGLEPPSKRESHRALGDILESIEELRFYRSAVFRSVP